MRQKGEEWSLDAANEPAEAKDFRVAYVALCSYILISQRYYVQERT